MLTYRRVKLPIDGTLVYRIENRPIVPRKPKFNQTPLRNAEIIGRSTNEANDCTVKALMAAECISYADAHAVLDDTAICNRAVGHGINTHAWNHFLDKMYKRIPLPGATCQTAIPRLTNGHYIVNLKTHTFAVVNGVAIDVCYVKPGSRIEAIWQVR